MSSSATTTTINDNNNTAIIKFNGARKKADDAIKKLEQTVLTCFICDKEGDGEPQSFTLFKNCGKHHVCSVHKGKKHLITRHEKVRGSEWEALKCNCKFCKADAMSPPVPLDRDVCTMNEQVHKTLVHLKNSSEATNEFEKFCNKEIAAASNRADARVAFAEKECLTAEAKLSDEQAKVRDLEERMRQQEAAGGARPPPAKVGIRDLEGEEKKEAQAEAKANRLRLAKKRRIEETREQVEHLAESAITAGVIADVNGFDDFLGEYQSVMKYREEGPAKKAPGRKRRRGTEAAAASSSSAPDMDVEIEEANDDDEEDDKE